MASSSAKLPNTLDETKLFKNNDPHKPEFGVYQYEVKVPLWSDGSVKTRYIFVPADSKIKVNASTGEFDFPVGTTLAKHFDSVTGGKPVETRVMVKKSDGKWYGTTYLWDGTSKTEAQYNPKAVDGPDGNKYRLPSEKECKMCHNTESPENVILGFNVHQLNFKPKGADKSELERLKELDLFDSNIEGFLASKSSLADIADKSIPIADRARTYIHVNCSPCHNPTGAAYTEDVKMDFRLATSLENTGLSDKNRLVRGNPLESKIFQRISAETERMPPISLRLDHEGIDIIKQWITEMN